MRKTYHFEDLKITIDRDEESRKNVINSVSAKTVGFVPIAHNFQIIIRDGSFSIPSSWGFGCFDVPTNYDGIRSKITCSEGHLSGAPYHLKGLSECNLDSLSDVKIVSTTSKTCFGVSGLIYTNITAVDVGNLIYNVGTVLKPYDQPVYTQRSPFTQARTPLYDSKYWKKASVKPKVVQKGVMVKKVSCGEFSGELVSCCSYKITTSSLGEVTKSSLLTPLGTVILSMGNRSQFPAQTFFFNPKTCHRVSLEAVVVYSLANHRTQAEVIGSLFEKGYHEVSMPLDEAYVSGYHLTNFKKTQTKETGEATNTLDEVVVATADLLEW